MSSHFYVSKLITQDVRDNSTKIFSAFFQKQIFSFNLCDLKILILSQTATVYNNKMPSFIYVNFTLKKVFFIIAYSREFSIERSSNKQFYASFILSSVSVYKCRTFSLF